MAVRKIQFEHIEKSKGRTKKEELDKVSDKEIAEAVLSDKDSLIPKDKELKEFSKPRKRQ